VPTRIINQKPSAGRFFS